MKLIDVINPARIWGPGRKCVLCRALYMLMPGRTEVPDEVADEAIGIGAAVLVEDDSNG